MRPPTNTLDASQARLSESATKRHFQGTHRICTPEETLARVRPMFATLGITRLANITGLDRVGVPVVMACRPNSRSTAVFQGKGITLAAAKASAVMEALELWHAERITAPLVLASVTEMRGERRIVDVGKLARARPHPIPPTVQLLWIEGRDLLGGGPAWVPFEMVSTNYTLPLPPGSGYFQASSNGLASGNHPVEALIHALAEVIERDARTLWEESAVAKQDTRVVALDSIDDPDCRAVLDRMHTAGLRARVWDTTSNIGIASFVCQVDDMHRDGDAPELGSGCHPSRAIALLRALTEAAQARVTFIAAVRDDFFPSHYHGARRAARTKIMARRMQSTVRPRDFALAPHFSAACLEDDLDWMLARIRAAGVEQIIAVDLTRAAIGVPVVRVIVPGLEGLIIEGDSEFQPGPRSVHARWGTA